MSAVPAGTPIEAGEEVIRTPVGGLGVAVRYTGILETLILRGPAVQGQQRYQMFIQNHPRYSI